MGYTLHESFAGENTSLAWRTILLFVVVANLPDIDFLPGLLEGEPNKYHHHFFSHSLGSAVFVGGLLGTYFSRWQGKNFWSHFILFAGACYSHVILDYFTADTSQPYGVPMFWPFSETYYMSSVAVFMSVNKTNDSGTFIQSILVFHNLRVALWEIVVFAPILTIMKIVKKSGRLRGTVANVKKTLASCQQKPQLSEVKATESQAQNDSSSGQ